MVTTYTEDTRSRNKEATFREFFFFYSSLQFYWLLYVLNILGPKIWTQLLEEIPIFHFTLVVMVTTYMGQTRSRNMEATFRGNPKTIAYPSCNGIWSSP